MSGRISFVKETFEKLGKETQKKVRGTNRERRYSTLKEVVGLRRIIISWRKQRCTNSKTRTKRPKEDTEVSRRKQKTKYDSIKPLGRLQGWSALRNMDIAALQLNKFVEFIWPHLFSKKLSIHFLFKKWRLHSLKPWWRNMSSNLSHKVAWQ